MVCGFAWCLVGLYSLYVCSLLVVLLCLIVTFDLIVVLGALVVLFIWWWFMGGFVITCFGLRGVVLV